MLARLHRVRLLARLAHMASPIKRARSDVGAAQPVGAAALKRARSDGDLDAGALSHSPSASSEAASPGAEAGSAEKRRRAPKLPPSVHAGPSSFEASDHLPAADWAAFVGSIPERGTEAAASTTKIVSFNVNGLRAVTTPARKADLQAYVAREAPDVLCLQEIKIDATMAAGFAGLFASLPHAAFNCCATKAGALPLMPLSLLRHARPALA